MDPMVELDTGFVRGLVKKHDDGFNYYSFRGIPYAEPPINELRFEDPIPKKKWTGILECKDFGPRSSQYDFFTNKESYDEDCLYLNVYTWSINEPNENRPVLVWIHGGEFSFNASDDFYCGPDYLIRKNIVLVTITFRLGVLGFLDLEDEVAPGNQGLKDQVMALQWVQKNIRMFGGDPDNVTVGGVSAGAISAHYLALSPLAKNLLHKIICHGGTVYNPYARATSPRLYALKLCSFLGKTLSDSKEIVNFLKTVDTKALLGAQKRLREQVNGVIFGPGSDSKASTPSMPVHGCVAADQGVHIPALVGYTSRAGILALFEYFAACDLDFGTMFQYNMTEILQRYNLSVKQARQLYYKSEAVSDKNIDNYVDIRGDFIFIEGVHKFARVQAEMGSAATYLFRFDYSSADSLTKALVKDAPTGASHYEDIPYLFKMGLLQASGRTYFEKGTKNYKVMEQMTEMWANFATYGKPTIETSDLTPVQWQPIADGTNLRYMNIGEDLRMQNVLNIDQKFLSARQIQA